MIENNVTNMIKPQGGTNIPSGTSVAKNGKTENTDNSDFLALIIQNIQNGLQNNNSIQNSGDVKDVNIQQLAQNINNLSPNEQQQLQKLLKLSPEDLNKLINQIQNQTEISDIKDITDINDIILLIQNIYNNENNNQNNLPIITGVSSNGQELNLQTQLLSQQETTTNINAKKKTTVTANNINSNIAKSQDIENTNTKPQATLTNTPEKIISENTTGKNILSFNEGNVLQSFNSEEVIKQTKTAKKINPVEQNTTDIKNIKNLKTQIEQTSQNNIAISNKDVSNNINRSVNYLKTEISSNPILFSTNTDASLNLDNIQQLNNFNNNVDINSDNQVQGRPITAQNFASFTTAKAGHAFQTQTSQQIYMNIKKNAIAKIEQMTLQLEPAEMGRIEINMKFAKDGTMKAHLVLEKKETMNLLQRDANALENALKEAGIELEDNSLSFDMASSQDHFEQTREQQKTGAEFSLEMLLNQDTNTAQLIANNSVITKNTEYIRKDSVNILI